VWQWLQEQGGKIDGISAEVMEQALWNKVDARKAFGQSQGFVADQMVGYGELGDEGIGKRWWKGW